MDPNAAGLSENSNSLILRELSVGVNDHFVQFEPSSECEDKVNVPKESVKGQDKIEHVEQFLEDFKCELDVREKLDKVVTRFQNRLPVFVGFLGVLYTITFPCEMRNIYALLVALSCMGIILEGCLAIFHFWVIRKEVMILRDLYENLNTKTKGGSQFWWNACPHVIDTIVMLIYALTFVLIFGAFIYVKKCVKDPISPTPTPVSSDNMLFPIA